LQTLSDIYFSANLTNAASEVLAKLIAMEPTDPRPFITKSAIQMQGGALEEAVRTLTTVLENKPDYFPALVNRALAYTKLQRIDDAEKDYEHLLKIAPDMHQVYYHLGEIDYQRRDAAGARRNYRKFLETALAGSPEARTAQQRLEDIASGALSK
jgi:tetratricopeptide (TPR) repeat protein